VRQSIRMRVCLLESDAEEEKDSAEDGEYETYTGFRSPAVACSLHGYSLSYSSKFKRISQTPYMRWCGVSVRDDDISVTRVTADLLACLFCGCRLSMILIARSREDA
jgi:hypothetical protein